MPRPSRPPRFHGNSLKRNLSIGELNSVVTYLYTPIRPSTEQVLFSPAKRKKSACRRYQKTRKQESPTGHLPTVGFPSLHIRPPFLPNCHLQHKQYRVTGPVPSIPLFFFPFFVLPIVKGKKNLLFACPGQISDHPTIGKFPTWRIPNGTGFPTRTLLRTWRNQTDEEEGRRWPRLPLEIIYFHSL